MMTRTTLVLVGALVAVVSGCDSEVNGGGGGAGGGSGGATSVAETTGTSPTSGQGGGAVTSTSGPGGTTGGGGNTLGECTQEGGTAAATSGGTTQCGSDFACDGGAVTVFCVDDGTTETCDCSLGGDLVGTCIDADRSGCSFPQNCCFDLLGGEAEPNPGPYGSCDGTNGSATTSGSAGGTEECGSYFDCAGGQIEIECSQPSDGGAASCECIDGNGFLLGTCEQSTLDCDYESNCCHDIFN